MSNQYGPRVKQPRSERLRAAEDATLDGPAVQLLKAVQEVVCETTRAQIARALSSATLNVTELSRIVGKSKWTTSRQLRILRNHHVVSAHRQGREVFYTLGEGSIVDAALAALDVFDRPA